MLGDVVVDADDGPVDLGHTRQRTVLGVLLAEPGRPLPTDVIIDRLWGEAVPRSAPGTLHGYLSRLRRVVPITRGPGGYAVAAEPGDVDLFRFRELADRARRAGDREAVSLLTRALRLWRGPAFGGAESPWLDGLRDTLDQERLAAELDLAEAQLRLGEHAAVVPGLTALAADHPLDERIAEQVMRALHGAGRQADALLHYDGLRARLVDGLGIDPGPRLRALHGHILSAELEPAAPAGPVPAQLPPYPVGFTGREAAMAALTASVDDDRVTLCVIEGTAGVGKTATAVAFGHRQADRFPAGTLFLDLRGHGTGAPMSTDAALGTLLHGAGVSADAVPAGLDARAALWRTVTTGRRMLVLLDNAHDTAQVRALLPGPGPVVLVTSRNRLRGLVVRDGARRVPLGRLTTAEALRVLRATAGDEVVDAAPDVAEDLVAACAHLPLALRILAERVTHGTDLAALRAELRADRLTALALPDDADTDLRTVLLRSYRTLGAESARLFRLLGARDPDSITPETAAEVAGTDSSSARALLEDLVARHMLEPMGAGRVTFHDLMREFAASLAREHSGTDRRSPGRQVCETGDAPHRPLRDRAQQFLVSIGTDCPDDVRLPHQQSTRRR